MNNLSKICLPLQPEIEEVVSQPIISAFSERIDKPVQDEQAAVVEGRATTEEVAVEDQCLYRCDRRRGE